MDKNPKLDNSNLIDAIPHIGKCPNDCIDCYYNNGFYRTLDEPLLPSLEEVGDKIVRINSGHDSAIDKEHVEWSTRHYKNKFFNTALPVTDFSAPVVVTVNKNIDDKFIEFSDEECKNIMFVRIKTNTWNLDLVDKAVNYYSSKKTPVVLTMMRYLHSEHVKNPEDYEYQKNILNSYYKLKEEPFKSKIHGRYQDNVLYCGVPNGPKFCKECGNCEKLYNSFIESAP